MRYQLAALFATVFLFSACASTEQQLPPQAPPVAKEKEIKPVEPEREFTYTERYYVKGATIGDPTKVNDPLQAIRVIQLEPGSGEVLVLNTIDKMNESALETWFGIELPSFAPGIHDLAQATKVSFYRFYLGDDRKRIDGSSCEGRIKIESNTDGELIGAINATVNGNMKSFQAGNSEVKIVFTGSFRIQEEELENTIMKSR